MIEVSVAEKNKKWSFYTIADSGEHLPVFPDQTFESKVDAIVWFMSEYPETAESDGSNIFWHLFSGIETH